MMNQQVFEDEDYLYKSLNGQINVDEAQGIVEAFVAGVGNKDSVGDICLPGCFTSSLKRRKPRVVWGHDWNSPIGKVLEIYEVGPNDPRLPAKMRKAGIGGLYARVQFNLKAEKGREAFANVSFFGMEQEWSIGYKTLDAVFDPVQTANLLKEVELYEVSPVLHGANQLTGTISIKADEAETQIKEGKGPCWPGYKQVGMKKGKRGGMVPNCVPVDGKSLEDECCPEEKAADKPALRDPKGGLTAAGRAHFKRTEGANLKPGVRGAADTPEKMRRKGSFLTRFFTNPSGPMKKPNGKPTRLALSAAAWGEPVPQNASDASALAAKGRRLLERYENSKKKKKDDEDSIENKNHVAAIYAAASAPQNETFGRASQLTRALAARFGGPVRLVTADNDIAIFEMGAGQSTETMRVAYHYDGDEFMIGTAQQVKPETVYIPINQTTSGQTVGGVTAGISAQHGHHAGHQGHCCPGCGHGGSCDASVALSPGDDPRIAFVKLKSLGDQLNFKVVPTDGGFILEGFGLLNEESQDFVAKKVAEDMEKKFLNPIGNVSRRSLGVPDIRGFVRGFNVDMNPLTARDADLDRLVLEGNPLINMGRGIPDPTPFGSANRPSFDLPAARGDLDLGAPRMMPAVPDVPRREPEEVPEPVKPKAPPVRPPRREPSRPEREPTKPPVPVPTRPEREPARPNTPVPVPVPVPTRPREPVPIGEASNDNFAIAAMGGGKRTPKQIAEALASVDSEKRESRQSRMIRLRDSGFDEMRRLMLLDGPDAGMADPNRNGRRGRAVRIDSDETLEEVLRRRRSGQDISDMTEDIDLPNPGDRSLTDPTPGDAGMAGRPRTREESADLGRKIWLARTHDRLSLEEAGRRHGVSREEARQLELRHQKYLRDLGVDHPNRVGRATIDDANSGLTDAEADLLRRRLDGEMLEEAAERLGTDRFAVRRMEQLALAKLRNRIVQGDADAGMARGDGGRAVEADRPKASRVARPESPGKRRINKVDPTFSQIYESLRDSGPDGLTAPQRLRVAAMIRLRDSINNKITAMRVAGSRRRTSHLGPEIQELNDGIKGARETAAEVARVVVGSKDDFLNSAIKTANSKQDDDLDASLNFRSFDALSDAGGDVAKASRILGMDGDVVLLRAAAHSMRLAASAGPARRRIARLSEKLRHKLTSAESVTLRMWINGASDSDIIDRFPAFADERAVVAQRINALRKIGIDPTSPEMLSEVKSGRIFYDEFGLFAELVDDAGQTTLNRLGDGPMGGMNKGVRRVVSADFGDGRRDYAVTRTISRDRASYGDELVMLVPINGDDEATVSTLIGRALLGGDLRASSVEFPAVIRSSRGRVVGVTDASGRNVPLFGERSINASQALVATESAAAEERASELIKSIRDNDSASRIKMDQDVEVAGRRSTSLRLALDHLLQTGDWIGGDLGVTGRVPDRDVMFSFGLDADDDGSPIVPNNSTQDEFNARAVSDFLSDKPGATEGEIDDYLSRVNASRIAQVKRKAELAAKESDRLRHIRDSAEERRLQRVIDLETLDQRIAESLAEETRFISSLSGEQLSQLSRGQGGFAYVVHKGPDRLKDGVLDPSKSAGVDRSVAEVAGQGDTRGANRQYIQRFVQSYDNKRQMVSSADDMMARISRGERQLTVDQSIRRSLKAASPLIARIASDSGFLNLDELPEQKISEVIRDLTRFSESQRDDLARYEGIMGAIRRYGGTNADQLLSAEADPISALSSLNFYGRYADADLPRDVVQFEDGFVDNLTRRWNPTDEEMLERWNGLGGIRGGAFVVHGKRDSQIVSGGLLGPTSEAQIISPLKPLVGFSTPVRLYGQRQDDDPESLIPMLGPALAARAIKMHKRDGEIDIERLLIDPDLAPDGFVGYPDGASAGMASADTTDDESRTYSDYRNSLTPRGKLFDARLSGLLREDVNFDQMIFNEDDANFFRKTYSELVEDRKNPSEADILRLEALIDRAEAFYLPFRRSTMPHELEASGATVLDIMDAPDDGSLNEKITGSTKFVAPREIESLRGNRRLREQLVGVPFLNRTPVSFHSSPTGTVPYIAVRIGRKTSDLDGDTEFHPASVMRYVALTGDGPVNWNHPSMAQPNRANDWTPEMLGKPFRLPDAEADFHLSRRRTMDRNLSHVGDSPQKVVLGLRRRYGLLNPDIEQNRLWYDTGGWLVSLGASGSERFAKQGAALPGREFLTVTEMTQPRQLEELVKKANEAGKPLLLEVMQDIRPIGNNLRSEKIMDDIRMARPHPKTLDHEYHPLMISKPRIIRGYGNGWPSSDDFQPDEEGPAFVAGRDALTGREIRVPLRQVLMSHSPPSRERGEFDAIAFGRFGFSTESGPMVTDRATEADSVSAGMSGDDRWKPTPSYGEGRRPKFIYTVVDAVLGDDNRLDQYGVVRIDAAYVAAGRIPTRYMLDTIYALQSLDASIGAPYDHGYHFLRFVYPSSGPTEGLKSDAVRMILDPTIVFGRWNPDEKRLYILAREPDMSGDWNVALYPLDDFPTGPNKYDWTRRELIEHPDVTSGTLSTYVLGREMGPDGKWRQRVFNTSRMKADTGPMDEVFPIGPLSVPDRVATWSDGPTPETEPSDAPRIKPTDPAPSTEPRTPRKRPAAPSFSGAKDVPTETDDTVIEDMEAPRPEAFVGDEPTTMPVDPKKVKEAEIVDKTKTPLPTARDVAIGLAANDPVVIEARRNDEAKWWQKLKQKLLRTKILKTWNPETNEIKDENDNAVLNPVTGRKQYRLPFRAAWKPWGNPIAADGTESDELGFKGSMDLAGGWRDIFKIMSRKRLAFVDIETTGIVDDRTGGPVQIAVHVVEPGGDWNNPKIINVYIRPEEELSDWARDNLKVKIGDKTIPIQEALASHPEIFVSKEEARKILAEAVGNDSVIISHNWRSFDSRVWNDVMGDHPTEGWVDTLALANWLFAVDKERFGVMAKQLKEALGAAGDSKVARNAAYDRLSTPFVAWLKKAVKIDKPGGKSWGKRFQERIHAIDRLYRFATGPLWYKERLSVNGNWWPDPYASTKNEALALYFGHPILKAHDANADIEATRRNLLAMIELGDKWGAARFMFDRDSNDLLVSKEDETWALNYSAWKQAHQGIGAPTENLFAPRDTSAPGDAPSPSDGTRRPDAPGGSPDEPTTPSEPSAPGGGDRPPGGPRPPRPPGATPRGPTPDPDRVPSGSYGNGVRIYKGIGGKYVEMNSIAPATDAETAAFFVANLFVARQDGIGFQFTYGVAPDGTPRTYRLLSIEVVPKPGLTPEEARRAGIGGFVILGLDAADGRQKTFDFDLVNLRDRAFTSEPGFTKVPLPTDVYGGKDEMSLTKDQYVDLSRRRRFNNDNRTTDGPMAGMSGLTNRDGYSDSPSYWRVTEQDVEADRLSDAGLAERLRSDKVRLENLINLGPSGNSDASSVLDSIAATQRVMRIRSNQGPDHNGISVTKADSDYSLSGDFVGAPGTLGSTYSLPANPTELRRELRRNADLSVNLNMALLSDGPGRALDRLARISRIPRGEIVARLTSHDYGTYADAASERIFMSVADGVRRGENTPSSLGLLVDPALDLQPASAAVVASSRAMGLNVHGTPEMMVGDRDRYGAVELIDLLADFNETVGDLFSLASTSNETDPRFRVRSRVMRGKLAEIAREVGNRHHRSLGAGTDSLQAGAQAGMGNPDPDLRRLMSEFVRMAPSMNFESVTDAGFDEDWKRLSDQVIDDFVRRPGRGTEQAFSSFGDALKGRASVVGRTIDRIIDPSKAPIPANSPLGREVVKSTAKILALIYDLRFGSTDMLGLLASTPGAGPGSGTSGLDVTYKMIDSGAAALFARGGRKALVAYLVEAVSLGLVPAGRAMGILDRLSPSPGTAAISSGAEAAMGRSGGSSPFGDADGIPILSGSKWLDARLHAIYGSVEYEKVARGIGERFADLASRDWDNPTDDDLVDIHHYSQMVQHDDLIERFTMTGGGAAPRGGTTDTFYAGRSGLDVTIDKVSALAEVSPERVDELMWRGAQVSQIRRLAAMDPFSRAEELNSVRRKRALARQLAGTSGGPIGTDGFSSLNFSGRTQQEDSFLDEALAQALDQETLFLGLINDMKRDGGSDAGMAKRNFVPQRYDIKPVKDGFVIIDMSNRNAVSSRVFKSRRRALDGARRMDVGDSRFDPFGPETPDGAPATIAESFANDPRTARIFQSQLGASRARLETDSKISSDESGLPSRLTLSGPRGPAEITKEFAAGTLRMFDNGASSIPNPSPEEASTTRLISGYVSTNAMIETVLGRLDTIARMSRSRIDESAEEIEMMVVFLGRMQKRRNYFYNQLIDRLGDDNPTTATINKWHDERAGIGRESSQIGDGGLPRYVLPEGLTDGMSFKSLSIV